MNETKRESMRRGRIRFCGRQGQNDSRQKITAQRQRRNARRQK